MCPKKRRARVSALRRRDGDDCTYCRQTLNFDDPAHPMYRTLDHVTPRALKRDHSLGNLVLACRSCNEWRGVQLNAQLQRSRRGL